MTNPEKRRPTTIERKLMLAMGITDIDQLDELLAVPISEDAVSHSEPPDEEYELLDRAIEWLELRDNAHEHFEALSESRYGN